MYPHPHWDEDGFGPNYRNEAEDDDIDLDHPDVQSIAEHLINWPNEPETPKKKSLSPFPFAVWPNNKPRSD